MADVERDEVAITRQVHFRVAEDGDGRTLEGQIVPYGIDEEVSDGGPHYRERWVPGVFGDHDPSRLKVWLTFAHEQGLRGIVGHAVALREESDGLYGDFRIHETSDGDKALHLVNEGLVRGMSLEAVVKRSRRTTDGVVERLKARLHKVTLTDRPAFPTAGVRAVRDEPEHPTTEDLEPVPTATAPEPVLVERDVGVIELLDRIGYEPLVHREIVNRDWDGSPARFDDDEYERSCVVCRPGDEPPKTRCSLPVLEPNGDLNRNAVHQAAARLNQTGLSPELKGQAARKLVRYYRQLDEQPPDALVAQAGR